MSRRPAFVVPPPNVIEILRGTKSFAPVLGRLTVAAGAIIGLAPLAELAEQELERRIKQGLKKKTKRDKSDNRRVIKVSDAISCVEDHLRDPRVLLRTAKEIVAVFTGEPRTIINVLTDEIATCIRDSALGQNNDRTRGSYIRRKPEDQEIEFEEKVQIRKGKLHPFA